MSVGPSFLRLSTDRFSLLVFRSSLLSVFFVRVFRSSSCLVNNGRHLSGRWCFPAARYFLRGRGGTAPQVLLSHSEALLPNSEVLLPNKENY